jgi:hypothetical protein
MSATALGAIIAVVAGYASSVYLIINRIEGRLDRIEDRLTTVENRLGALEIITARIDQRLEDHLTDHASH